MSQPCEDKSHHVMICHVSLAGKNIGRLVLSQAKAVEYVEEVHLAARCVASCWKKCECAQVSDARGLNG